MQEPNAELQLSRSSHGLAALGCIFCLLCISVLCVCTAYTVDCYADQGRKTISHKTGGKTNKARDDHEVWLKRVQENADIMLGIASWYGSDFNMRPTASGVPYNMYTFTAAHRTLPLGTVVRVTDQYNGKSVIVCITDRGPFIKGRIIDMSYAAAESIGFKSRGISRVGVEVVSDEKGRPLREGEAFFVDLRVPTGPSRFGPYNTFADAAAMHEAVLVAHPEASVVLDTRDSQ